MKKKMYKLLSLILVCTLIMTCNGTVLAANNGNLSENDELISSYIQDIRDNPEMYGYQSKELETLYMGAPIYSYAFLDSGSIQRSNYEMYPIFSDAGLLFFALKYTNSDHLEITQAMVTELASQVDSTKSIAIIYDAIACYIYESNHNELISLKTFSTEIQETIQGRGILNSSFNIKDSLETSSLSPVKMLPYTENTIQARAISNIVLSVPVVKQTPYNNLCWAACVTCVGNYVTGRNYTIETIAKSMYDDSNFDQTATEVTTRLALDYNYGISYLNSTTSTPPSETLIYNNLSQGYPVLGYCRSIQYSLYHMVVIRGVNPSISRIYLMVPEYGYVISNKTSGVYSYTSPYSGIPLELYGYGSKL